MLWFVFVVLVKTGRVSTWCEVGVGVMVEAGTVDLVLVGQCHMRSYSFPQCGNGCMVWFLAEKEMVPLFFLEHL
jgi:hypothetical protein